MTQQPRDEQKALEGKSHNASGDDFPPLQLPREDVQAWEEQSHVDDEEEEVGLVWAAPRWLPSQSSAQIVAPLAQKVPAKADSPDTESPLRALCWLWLLACLLTLYSADSLQAWVLRHRALSTQRWAISTSEQLVVLAKWTGLSTLSQQISGGVRSLDKWQLSLAKAKPRRPVVHRERKPRDRAKVPLANKKRQQPPLGRAGVLAGLKRGKARRIRRILLVGASSIQYYLGVSMERYFRRYEEMMVARLGKLGTGLADRRGFDWFAELPKLKLKHKPDLIFVSIGVNDIHSFRDEKGKYHALGSSSWEKAYAQLVRRFVRIARRDRCEVVVLGRPVMRSRRLTGWMTRINKILKAETEAEGGRFLSTWTWTRDPEDASRFRQSILWAGQVRKMRMRDGIHFSMYGARYLAEQIAFTTERWFSLRPGFSLSVEGQSKGKVARTSTLGSARRYDLQSRFLGRMTSYLAYQPATQRKGGKAWPLLLLLHGASDNWLAWSHHAHRELQRLATKHQLVIVTPDGSPDGWYLDSPIAKNRRFASYLRRELLPDIAQRLPVTRRRAISGLSMGGHGALTLAWRSPSLFVAVSAMSAVTDLTQARSRRGLVRSLGTRRKHKARWEAHSANRIVLSAKKAARTLPLLLTVGRSDRWARYNRRFHRLLTKHQIKHLFRVERGGHDWGFWMRQLPIHVAWLARHLHAKPSAQKSVPKVRLTPSNSARPQR